MITEMPLPIPDDITDLLHGEVAAASRRGLFRGAGRGERARAAQADEILEAGTCEQITVHHEQPPVTATHEHGLIVLIPRADGTAHLLDISSVSDDPRWQLHSSGALWTREWKWIRAGDLGPFRFAAAGDPLMPAASTDLHGTRLETHLSERDDGWPGDDTRLDITYLDAIAWLRE